MLNSLFSFFKRKSLTVQGMNGRLYYSGNYRNGKASYYYNNSENGRIYEGKFRFSAKYYGDLRTKTTDKVNGCFRHGYKNGTWILSRKGPNGNKVLSVDYAGGIHEGTYHFHGVSKSHYIGGCFGCTDLILHMHNGHPVGEVKCSFGSEVISGNCDEEGRPDGMWTVDLSKTKEHCIEYESWEHGVKADSYLIDASTGNKKHYNRSIVDIVTSFVYSECLPLEHIIRKGSKGWHGNFATSMERKISTL